jgi:hypothetical protein
MSDAQLNVTKTRSPGAILSQRPRSLISTTSLADAWIGRRVPAHYRNGRSMCRWGCNGLPPGLGCKLSYNLRAPKTCP